MSRFSIALILLFLTSNFTFSQDIEITAATGKYILDENLQLIVCNKDITEHNDLSNANSLTLNLNGNNYEFSTIPNKLVFGEQYVVTLSSQDYKLYFSQLPLININTTENIQDEPKVLASFLLTDTSNSDAITSYCGIELRGGFSQSYPKKSYDIELWEDETGDKSTKKSLLNMRKDDDWLLFGIYNEPLRIRNSINHKLWRDIHTPYYISQEADAKSGIETQYIELAVNDEYMGIYLLGEQVDKSQLKLKKYKTSIKGELYKGISWGKAVTFSELQDYNNSSRTWSGYEMKYPKESDITDWENLYNFVDFVINSTDNDFEQNIESEFVINNAVDYFIFLNLLRATDNTGKNIYVAKYTENEPYLYVPWDLDGTFGTIWTGKRKNIYNDILKNGLYNRLLNANSQLFNNKASIRWSELRNTILEKNNLIDRISQSYNFLLSNANYERESLKWGQESIDLTNLDYTYEWLENRLNFLDEYFGSLLGVEDGFNTLENFNIFPNPIASTFEINTTAESVFYKIYNTNGALLKKGISNKNEHINIDNFSSGIYLLKIITDNNQFANLKIIKE